MGAARRRCLLRHVRQFMRQQLFALWRLRCELPRSKGQMLARRIRKCVDGASRARGGCVRMYAHIAERATKARLKEGSCCLIERLTRRVDYLMHAWRRNARRRCLPVAHLLNVLPVFLFAGSANAADLRG